MLKAVIFDMDGVIVDTEPVYRSIETRLALQLGIPFPEEEQEKYAGIPYKDMWEHLFKEYNCGLAVDEVCTIQSQQLEEYYKSGDLLPIAPTVELIGKLPATGIKCAIATSSDRCNAGHIVDRLNIGPYISTVVTSGDVKKGKPAPDIFLLAAELLGVKPEECIVIEDSGNGCNAAKAAGMTVIGYRNPLSGNQDLSSADIVVDDIGELAPEKLVRFIDKMK